MEIIGLETALVEDADEIDVGGIVQLPRAHLAHGKDDHARAIGQIVHCHTGQLAAFDLGGKPHAKCCATCRIGVIGQRAGHFLQRPNPTKIGQGGQQRHAPLALPQPIGQTVGREFCCRVSVGRKCRFGVLYSLRKPIGFLL